MTATGNPGASVVTTLKAMPAAAYPDDPTCDCQRPHPDPEDTWRHIDTEVVPKLWVTGQPLAGDTSRLAAWEGLGAKVVVDVTTHGHALPRPSAITRVWLPTPDDGAVRDATWLDSVGALDAHTPTVVHCPMGVNRAPVWPTRSCWPGAMTP